MKRKRTSARSRDASSAASLSCARPAPRSLASMNFAMSSAGLLSLLFTMRSNASRSACTAPPPQTALGVCSDTHAREEYHRRAQSGRTLVQPVCDWKGPSRMASSLALRSRRLCTRVESFCVSCTSAVPAATSHAFTAACSSPVRSISSARHARLRRFPLQRAKRKVCGAQSRQSAGEERTGEAEEARKVVLPLLLQHAAQACREEARKVSLHELLAHCGEEGRLGRALEQRGARRRLLLQPRLAVREVRRRREVGGEAQALLVVVLPRSGEEGFGKGGRVQAKRAQHAQHGGEQRRVGGLVLAAVLQQLQHALHHRRHHLRTACRFAHATPRRQDALRSWNDVVRDGVG